ncbi:mig-22 [Pristionchus pacificus]|nr:mig-22 [Pristionchus pacificus]
MSGARTGLPLLGGILLGLFISYSLFAPPDETPLVCPVARAPEFIDSSEFWTVNQEKTPQTPPADTKQGSQVARARFAATELGIRERILVLVWAETGRLAAALNGTLAKHVSRVVALADSVRLDVEMSLLPSLVPFKSNSLHAHTHILNAVFNYTLQENYDWFLIMKESTYINPFALQEMINKMSWSEKVILGVPDSSNPGRCVLDAGILLSNPTMQMLIQQRHVCNNMLAGSDEQGMEMCIHAATNVSCRTEHQGREYRFWRVSGTESPHEEIQRWSMETPSLNSSLSVGSILSTADASALHDHFIRVEVDKVEAEILKMEEEIEGMEEDLPDGPSWPIGTKPFAHAPNRYQVPVWEFFTATEIFKNEPNQNVRPITGSDKEDIDEIIESAKRKAEEEEGDRRVEFVRVSGGYRQFDAARGMDYMVDLVYRDVNNEETIERRIHLARIIERTTLVNTVPYVKEDADLTIVVPIAEEVEVLPGRRLLARQARLCTSPTEENRHTRVVVAVSARVEHKSLIFIQNDLEELKKRCKRSSLEASLLSVSSDNPSSLHAAEALDEAIDHFGPQSMFLLLSPYADIQKELLDRARINTIKKFQVFLPIPFIEYHPTISGMDLKDGEKPDDESTRQRALGTLKDAAPPQRTKGLMVQKEHGRFDPLDFSVVCIYGSDYMEVRPRLMNGKRIDVGSAFLNMPPGVHILRAIEPALRLRYHRRECDPDLEEDDLLRCTQSRRENLAAKDQLARLVFNKE